MYIRFVTNNRDAQSGRRQGLFYAGPTATYVTDLSGHVMQRKSDRSRDTHHLTPRSEAPASLSGYELPCDNPAGLPTA